MIEHLHKLDMVAVIRSLGGNTLTEKRNYNVDMVTVM